MRKLLLKARGKKHSLEIRNITKNTAIVSITTLISRILGYLRDMLLASYLGTGPLNDAFIAAFKFANLFRNIFGEGALTAAFVPMFSKKLSLQKNANEALAMASLVQSTLIAILLIFSLIIIALMPCVMTFTTPGFRNNATYFQIAVEVGRITFPYLFFISLAAFYGGMLHSIGKFMPFAATAIIFNIVMILFSLYCDFGSTKAHSIAYGVLAAGILEFIWMLHFLKANKILLPLCRPRLTEDIKSILRKMGAGIFGSSISQINTWVDMIIISFIPGGMSYIYYADRVAQLPLALVATATATTLLPYISKYIASNETNKAQDAKDSALRINAFFLIPSSVFLFTFSHEILSALLERGNFDNISAHNTSISLKFAAIGLPAFALIKLFSSNFYAHGDTKTPAKIAFASLLINIILSLSLLHTMHHAAVSLASSCSAWFTSLTLIYISLKSSYYRMNKNIILHSIFFILISLLTSYLSYTLINTYYLKPLYSLFFGGAAYVALSLLVMNKNPKISSIS